MSLLIFVSLYIDVVRPPKKGKSPTTASKRRLSTSTSKNCHKSKIPKTNTRKDTRKSDVEPDSQAGEKAKEKAKAKEKEREKPNSTEMVDEQELRFYLESSLLGPEQRLTVQHHLAFRQPMAKSFLQCLLKAADAQASNVEKSTPAPVQGKKVGNKK